jgi:hypothetical protein
MGAALPASLGTAGAFAAQVLMALLLLRHYSPESVGYFSVVAQVAFAWASLALAQAPISLLANTVNAPEPSVARLVTESVARWLILMPVAVGVALWVAHAVPGPSEARAPLLLMALAAAAMSWFQAGWILAQSVQLRWGSPTAIALVRLSPPWIAVSMAAGAVFLHEPSTLALVMACVVGFAVGCMGLLQRHFAAEDGGRAAAYPGEPTRVGDPRSARLKMAHTLSDLAISTVLALQWAALYGAAAAGLLLITLRVLALIPTLVSTGWSHGILSRPVEQRPSLVWVVGLASLALAGLAWLVQLLVSIAWIAAGWEALQRYILPVACWQGGAILVAAVAYRPFLARRPSAQAYSRMCIGSNLIQLLMLAAPPSLGLDQATHLWLFVATVTALQGSIAAWAASLELRH